MIINLSKDEARYLAFVIEGDLETLENGDWEDLPGLIEKETAKRLLGRIIKELNKETKA